MAYNAELDQIMISVRSFGEFWIIDHGTTTAEAAGHKGGKRGKGGDLLYRWGNPHLLPRRHEGGSTALRPARRPLDSQRATPALGTCSSSTTAAAGRRAITRRSTRSSSPSTRREDYTRTQGEPFGPREPVWSYTAPKKEELFAFIMSGANRLPNGNTLICESVSGTIFEVTHKGETVWKYANPAGGSFAMGMPGGPPMGGPPTLADVLPPMFQFMLNLTSEQKTKLDATQKEVVGKLETILDASQRKQLLERRAADPMGFAGMATPGQILPLAAQIVAQAVGRPENGRGGAPEGSRRQDRGPAGRRPEGSDEADTRHDGPRRPPRLPPRRSAPGPGAPPPGPGGPPGPPGGFGGNSVFRAYRYAKDYPGLAGKDLTPGKTVEELERKRPEEEAK